MDVPSNSSLAQLDTEIASYDWRRLRSFSADSSTLPAAIKDLARAETEKDARVAYWHIDNVTLVQGRLSESTPAVVSCIVAALPAASTAGRTYMLDLLAAIAGGYDDHIDVAQVGPVSAKECVRRMLPAISLYVDELRREGNPSCVDILLMCGMYEERIRNRVASVLTDAQTLDSCARIRDLLETSLAELD